MTIANLRYLVCTAVVASGCAADSETATGRRGSDEIKESPELALRLEPFASLHTKRAGRYVRLRDGRIAPRTPVRVLARARLPDRADGALRLEDTGSAMAVEARLLGARPAFARATRGLLIYPDAIASGSDLLLRADGTGIEDLITFPTRPQREALSYRVRLFDVAGLRQVGGGVEFLDSRGSPRLRVAPPFVIDRDGQFHSAVLEIAECAVDRDPRPPWGRPVVVPGASECGLELRWDRASIAYPAVVDPSWTTTRGTMAVARRWAEMVELEDGRALICGGDLSGSSTNSCELFDPADETWASTDDMNVARRYFTLSLLDDGRVLAAAGLSTTGERTAETRDPATGTWTAAPSLSSARYLHSATKLSTGQIVIAGGQSGSAYHSSVEVFTTSPDAWSGLPPMQDARAQHAAAPLSGDRVFVAGGSDGASFQGAELYDPEQDAWVPTAQPLAIRRFGLTATPLRNGRVLLAGGYQTALLDRFDIFDPATGQFTSGQMHAAHSAHTASVLLSGSVLIAGGCNMPDCSDGRVSAEIFDIDAETFVLVPDMQLPRASHAAATLRDGRVLVAGGNSNFAITATSELFALNIDGEACSSDVQCASGSCLSGLCGGGSGGGSNADGGATGGSSGSDGGQDSDSGPASGGEAGAEANDRGDSRSLYGCALHARGRRSGALAGVGAALLLILRRRRARRRAA